MAGARKRKSAGGDDGRADGAGSIKMMFERADQRRLSGAERERRQGMDRMDWCELVPSGELNPFWVEHLRISFGAGSRPRIHAYLDALERSFDFPKIMTLST